MGKAWQSAKQRAEEDCNRLLDLIDNLEEERELLRKALNEALTYLEKLHPMSPDEPCAIYEVWKQGKEVLLTRSVPEEGAK